MTERPVADPLTAEEREYLRRDADGYLSRCRPYLARLQRERRARLPRIDYYPSAEARAAIKAKRGRYCPLNTNSGILNAIVVEWAALTGIKCGEVEPPKRTPTGIIGHIAGARRRERLCDLSSLLRPGARVNNSAPPARPLLRVPCGARRRRDGLPCEALSVPGKRRCKWHGGCSTGPRTPEGKAKVLANLRRGRAEPSEMCAGSAD